MKKKSKKQKQFVLIVGNPIDGLKIIGPFGIFDDAVNYAEGSGKIDCGDWWITTLHKPKT